MAGRHKTAEEVAGFYAGIEAAQNEYRRTGNADILWAGYDELTEMAKSALKAKAGSLVNDFESAARDIAVLLIGKMKERHVKYPGALAKAYANRFLTGIRAERIGDIGNNRAVYEETAEEDCMSGLTAFSPVHLHTPIGQLYALQILAQEQLGLGPAVPPEEINRYLSRKIKVKKGETWLAESDFSCVFNWDGEGRHGVPWKLWLTQRLEQLSRMTVTKLDKSIRMPVYAFRYTVHTLGKLAEIGIRINGFGKARDIFTVPGLSYVRRNGAFEGVFEPVEDRIIIFDQKIIDSAVKVFRSKENSK